MKAGTKQMLNKLLVFKYEYYVLKDIFHKVELIKRKGLTSLNPGVTWDGPLT
jgi:hypothetical protein